MSQNLDSNHMELVPSSGGHPAALSVADTIAESRRHQEALQAQMRRLREQVVLVAEEQQRERDREEALRNFQSATPVPPPAPMPGPPLPRKRGAKVPPEIEALVFQHVFEDKDMTWQQAEHTFHVSHSYIGNLRQREEKRRKGEVLPPKKRGRHSIVTSEALVFILETLETDDSVTLEEISELLRRQNLGDLSVSTINKAIVKMDITWKERMEIPLSWNTPEVRDARTVFAKLMGLEYMNKLHVYIDEQGYNLHVRRSRGRALAGHRAHNLTLSPKGPHVTLIAALSPAGFIYHQFVVPDGKKKRGCNASDFANFLRGLGPRARGAVLILDNARIHHSQLKELDDEWKNLANTYGITRQYLPPYSPFLNPIEYAFNTLKTDVKSRTFTGTTQLQDAIEAGLRAATPEHAQAYIARAQSFYSDAYMGVRFLGTPLFPRPDREQPPPASFATALGACMPAADTTSTTTTATVSAALPIAPQPLYLPSSSSDLAPTISFSSSSPSPLASLPTVVPAAVQSP